MSRIAAALFSATSLLSAASSALAQSASAPQAEPSATTNPSTPPSAPLAPASPPPGAQPPPYGSAPPGAQPAPYGSPPRGAQPPPYGAPPPGSQPAPYPSPPQYGWPPPQGWAPTGPASNAPNVDRAERERRAKLSEHNHDGFYLRLGIGYGYLNTSSSFSGDINGQPARDLIGDFTYSGSGPALDFAIGGTPARGLVIGYAYAGQIVLAPRVTIETPYGEQTKEPKNNLASATHGLLVDVFPNPRGNLELGGLVGFAVVSTGQEGNSSLGMAGAIWGGYGVWASDQMSLVGLLRLGYSYTESDTTSVTGGSPIARGDSTLTLSVLGAMLWH